MEADTHAPAPAQPTTAPIRHIRWRHIKRAWPYLLTLVYAAGLALMLSRHEMWRDETQAWLLARDAASPAALLHNMRYEGHPGLWHLLLWGPAQLTANPAAMQVVHWAIATLAVFILLTCAPFRWPTRILLASSYFVSYEWAVISRNYAISMLLFFAFAALHRKRWAWFPAQAAVAFCLCHTNIHSIIIVLVLLPTLAVEYAVAYAGDRGNARRHLLPVCLGMLLMAAGLATGIRQTSPPKDSGFAEAWHFKWDDARAQSTASRMVRAYAPVPRDTTNYWNSNRFAGQIKPEHQVAAALWIIAATCLLFLCQPWPIVPYLAGTFSLIAFFYIKYPGSTRHHGFLFLLPIILLWMSWDYKRPRLPWRWANWPPRIWRHLRELPLAALLILHVQGSAIAIQRDWNQPFSGSKATAEWIRSQMPQWPDMLLAGFDAPATSAVVAHLQAPHIYYTARGDFGSYVIWDDTWRASPSASWRRQLTQLMKETGKELLLISTSPIHPLHRLPAGTTLRHTVRETATVEPVYFIYHCPAPAP